MSMRVLPTKEERPRVSLWIFFIAWLMGNIALVAGFEAAEGFLDSAIALCVLAVAGGLWWGAYKFSDFRSRGGFVVLGLWLLGTLVPLRDFHYTIRNPFFWGSTALLSSLLVAALFVRPRPKPEQDVRSE